MSSRNSGSERSRVRVKVHRNKYDENGQRIPHVHKHHTENQKFVQHSDGKISKKTDTSTYDTGVTVDPITTSDLTFEMFENPNFSTKKQKPTKASYQRYTRRRTKVNTVGKIKHFDDSSDEGTIFTELEPKFEAPVIKYGHKFSGKGMFDTTTASSASTIESLPTTTDVVSRDINTPTPDQTNVPRTSQSFTSFMGTDLAKITQFTQLPEDPENPRKREFDKSDPFKVAPPNYNSKDLYPEGRGIPTHSDEIIDPEQAYRWIYRKQVTSLNDIGDDNLEVIENDNNSNTNSGSFFGDSYIKSNAFSPRNSVSSRSPKKIEDESTKTETQTATYSSAYLQYNEQYTSNKEQPESQVITEVKETNDPLTTVSELISATAGSAEYVEARTGEQNAENYVEQTKSDHKFDSHVEMSDDETIEEEEEEEEDDYDEEEEEENVIEDEEI